jgi:hypothetical protein
LVESLGLRLASSSASASVADVVARHAAPAPFPEDKELNEDGKEEEEGVPASLASAPGSTCAGRGVCVGGACRCGVDTGTTGAACGAAVCSRALEDGCGRGRPCATLRNYSAAFRTTAGGDPAGDVPAPGDKAAAEIKRRAGRAAMASASASDAASQANASAQAQAQAAQAQAAALGAAGGWAGHGLGSPAGLWKRLKTMVATASIFNGLLSVLLRRGLSKLGGIQNRGQVLARSLDGKWFTVLLIVIQNSD